jgi:hypothetical protein
MHKLPELARQQMASNSVSTASIFGHYYITIVAISCPAIAVAISTKKSAAVKS